MKILFLLAILIGGGTGGQKNRAGHEHPARGVTLDVPDLQTYLENQLSLYF
jgi:hypothetical protein